MATALVFQVGTRALRRVTVATIAIWAVWWLDQQLEDRIVARCHW